MYHEGGLRLLICLSVSIVCAVEGLGFRVSAIRNTGNDNNDNAEIDANTRDTSSSNKSPILRSYLRIISLA